VIEGEVRKVERNQGQSSKTGKPYDFFTVYLLCDVEVYECGISRQWKGPIPEKGDQIAVEVSLRAYKDGYDGRAKLGIDILRYADDEPRRAAS
jgi:hypothetical protein